MGRLFDGTNDSLQAANVDLSGVNSLTFVFWLWWDSFTNNDDLAFEFDADINTTTTGFIVNPNSTLTGASKFEVSLRGNGGFCNALIIRPSAGAWHHYAIVMDKSLSANEINKIYVDGVSQSITYSNNNNNTNNFGNKTLNFMCRNNTSLFGAGRLAEVAIYPGVTLTADEVAALAKRCSPLLVRRTAKPYYWPLIGRTSPELELLYGNTATVNGAVVTDHPAIIYPSQMPLAKMHIPGPSASTSESASPSTSASTSPSASPSTSESASPSTSASASPSISASTSESASPSTSPSASPSTSASTSESASPSQSASTSESASPSTSESASPSASESGSATESASPSASSSTSSSTSPSTSSSTSPSASPSLSASGSSSPSASSSKSASTSPSTSPSRSPSTSPSASPSTSRSSSPSKSPSQSESASPSASPSTSVSASPSSSASRSPSTSSSKSESASPSPSDGEEEVPCNLTLAELRARVLADLDDTNPGTYWTDAEVDHALNVAQRLWCLLTLCLEKQASFNVTSSRAFYTILDQIQDFIVPLRISCAGVRLKADTLHNLDLRSSGWRQATGTPTRYAQHGFDLLAVTPHTDSALIVIYAAEPMEMVSDSDIPEIAPEQQIHLPDFAFWFCRLKEGSAELQNAVPRLNMFLDAATKYAGFTRARSKAQMYDNAPVDLSTFERGRFLIKLRNQPQPGKKRNA